MSLLRNGFQTFVQRYMAPGNIGDFASMNPRVVALAGQGAFRAADASSVIVGNFAWGDPSTGLAYGALRANSELGFVANELQTVITQFLGQFRLSIEQGFPVTLYKKGDFWTIVNPDPQVNVAVGATVYADAFTGAPTVDDGAFSATGVQTASSNVVTISAVTEGVLRVGDVLTGTGVDAGLTVLSQLTGNPGAAGTYTVSTTTGFASTTVTVAANNPDTGYKVADLSGADPNADATAINCSLDTNGVLTVGTVTGSIDLADQFNGNSASTFVSGTGIPPNTFILAQLTGSPGQTGTYQVNRIGTVIAGPITCTFSTGKLVKISSGAF